MYEKLLNDIQHEVGVWNKYNFPKGTPSDVLIGATEELGELCHAHLKGKQGIRGTKKEHEVAAKDALGDIIIYLMAYCEKSGYSLQDCIRDAWEEVATRDWKKHKKNGKKRKS